MTAGRSNEDARAAAESVARRSYGKLVAFLAARTRDVAAAEDALSEAFASALTDWPAKGCPSNPEGWLLTVARRKIIDGTRRKRSHEAATAELSILADALDAASAEAIDAVIPDQRLALMFACTHPAIDAAVRAPLMLQVGVRVHRVGDGDIRILEAHRPLREAGSAKAERRCEV